jgi:superfamily II DNA/RNA helicase
MPKHTPRGDKHRSNRKDAPYNDNNDDKGRNQNPHRQQRRGNDERRSRHRRDDDTDPCSTFDDMKLKPDLLKGVYAYGFEKPSAIQQRAIRPIIRGRDVIAQSQSGTGKTAVFSISALQLLEESSRDVQVLVLSPTRELAEQSQRVLQSLGDFMNVRKKCFGTKHETPHVQYIYSHV